MSARQHEQQARISDLDHEILSVWRFSLVLTGLKVTVAGALVMGGRCSARIAQFLYRSRIVAGFNESNPDLASERRSFSMRMSFFTIRGSPRLRQSRTITGPPSVVCKKEREEGEETHACHD